MEKLNDVPDRGRRTPLIEFLDARRRSDIDQTIEVQIYDVVVQGTDKDAARGLIANPQHLGPITLRRNVLVAPASFFQADATSCGRIALQPDALGFCPVARQPFRIGHLYRRNQVDDFAYVFAFGGEAGAGADSE